MISEAEKKRQMDAAWESARPKVDPIVAAKEAEIAWDILDDMDKKPEYRFRAMPRCADKVKCPIKESRKFVL